MARHYVRIDSVDDIDITKIGVGNIEVRYIDSKGRRYATRFNKRKRKVEIVRIALGMDEANDAKRKKTEGHEEIIDSPLLQKKNKINPAGWKIPDWLQELNIEPDESIDVKNYMSSLERETEKFGERFRGIISNLKNSSVFDREDTERDFILDITTHYDHDIQEYLSKAQNMMVEFQRFPKNISNYVAGLDRKQKDHVEKMNSDSQMRYVQAMMVGETVIEALHGGYSLLNTIKEECDKVNAASLTGEKKKFFENATVTIDYVKDNVTEELSRLLGWMKITEVI